MVFNNINIGITTECNAKCYLCNRTCIPEFPSSELAPEILDKIIPFTKRIQIIGGFGDFINHPKSLEFAHKLKDIDFLIETNGELHDSSYWKELAQIANNKDQAVQFSIDDILNDVNYYRKVNTKKVLENLQTFISAGGYAKIKTILFEFNEDQIDQMREYFKSLEFYTQKSMFYPVSGKLSAPTGTKHSGSISILNQITSKRMTSPKSCQWQDGKWLLINELGEVHICCYILTFIAGMKDKAPKEISEYTKLKYYNELYDIYLKNKDKININNVTLMEAYNNQYNQYVINNYKNINRCKIACGIESEIKRICQDIQKN